MGAYMYCWKCEAGLPAPNELSSIELLNGLFDEEGGVSCPHCEAPNTYHREGLLAELAEALDKIREVGR